MVDLQLQQSFDLAAESVSKGTYSRVSNDVKLQLYALFSVVRKGKAAANAPSALLDPVGHAKWTAWSAVSGLKKDEAMREYVKLVDTLAADGVDGDAGRDGGFGGFGGGFGGKDITGFDIGLDNEDGGEMDKDLTFFAATGDIAQVLKALREDGVSANYRDRDGLTALIRAADRNQLQIVDVLLSHGAAINATDEDGQTALHYATICEHDEMAGLLISYGADAKLKDNDGDSAIEIVNDAKTKQAMVDALNGSWKRSSQAYRESTWSKFRVQYGVTTMNAMLAASLVCAIGAFLWRSKRSSYLFPRALERRT